MFHAAHGAQPLSRLCLSAALVLRYAEQDSLKRLPEELRAQQDNGRRVGRASEALACCVGLRPQVRGTPLENPEHTFAPCLSRVYCG